MYSEEKFNEFFDKYLKDNNLKVKDLDKDKIVDLIFDGEHITKFGCLVLCGMAVSVIKGFAKLGKK